MSIYKNKSWSSFAIQLFGWFYCLLINQYPSYKKRKKKEYIQKITLKIYKKKRFWPSEAWIKGKQISPLILPHNSLPPCSFHRLVPSFSLHVSACPRFRGTTHSISLQSSGTVTACSAQGLRQGAPHGGLVNDNPAKSSSPLGLIHQSNQVHHN